MRVLVITRLFPNKVEPFACAFQRQQLKCLAKRCDLEIFGMIPYFPGVEFLGAQSRTVKLKQVPDDEIIDGLHVTHPRALYLPGAGKTFAPINVPLYLSTLIPKIRSLRNRFDVVMGAFLYPDACAAALFAKMLHVPYVVRTHGTDVNILAQWPSIRPIIRKTLQNASGVVGVSQAMVDILKDLGAPADKTAFIPNGVNRDLFHPGEALETKRSLGLPEQGKVILYLGRLVQEKGLRELTVAFQQIAEQSQEPLHLVFVGGDGPLEGELKDASKIMAQRYPDGSRSIIVAGEKPLDVAAQYIRASFLMVLPSWAEGTPNVVLEAFASGRPVVGSSVGGIPAVIQEGINGFLFQAKNTEALTSTLLHALNYTYNDIDIVNTAPPSWDTSAEKLFHVLQNACKTTL